jgi:hypothetical protein
MSPVQLAEQAVDLNLKPIVLPTHIYSVLVCRRVDVSSLMSPVQLAEQAVDLNLKLMRWRAAPGLDIASMAATRCLLLGEWCKGWENIITTPALFAGDSGSSPGPTACGWAMKATSNEELAWAVLIEADAVAGSARP